MGKGCKTTVYLRGRREGGRVVVLGYVLYPPFSGQSRGGVESVKRKGGFSEEEGWGQLRGGVCESLKRRGGVS